MEWFQHRLNEAKTDIEKNYADFKLSEALKTLYSLIWNDFCSWYLEWIKPAPDQPIAREVYEKTVEFFQNSCRCCTHSCLLLQRRSTTCWPSAPMIFA
ncbi:class I tRNA ligase family protein [Paraflavitalea speifideaquila]|uniref:class I tRNA ligase family protein n=1 Tax=Paraflavitalea speifideaquila TaxID=3076558 RepID=UPI0028EEE309|nr:class I tRNA ligase family protein [Paraflavitalea speifideiaquila]